MKYAALPASFFIQNRFKLFGQLGEFSFVIVSSGSPVLRSGDQYYPFRPLPDFYYLTGIGRKDSFLVMIKGEHGEDMREVLFIDRPTAKEETWEGTSISIEGTAGKSGVKDIRWTDTMGDFIEDHLHPVDHFYLHDFTGTRAEETVRLMISNKLTFIKEQYLSPLMTRLRMIKEEPEITLIRSACKITREALLRVMRDLKPGMPEYEIEAMVTYEFLRKGAEGHAFDPILASGRHALILHYTENSGVCEAGDLLLMDIGAALGLYASDCSRTIPVNGRFSSRQRQVYASALLVLKQSMQLMKPGIRMGDFHAQVGRFWEEEHVHLGLYSMQELKNQNKDHPLWKNYYWHGTSHSIGIDVHDL